MRKIKYTKFNFKEYMRLKNAVPKLSECRLMNYTCRVSEWGRVRISKNNATYMNSTVLEIPEAIEMAKWILETLDE